MILQWFNHVLPVNVYGGQLGGSISAGWGFGPYIRVAGTGKICTKYDTKLIDHLSKYGDGFPLTCEIMSEWLVRSIQ